MKREFLEELKLSQEAIDAVLAEHEKTLTESRQAAQAWEEKYQQAQLDHDAAMAKLRFDGVLDRAINAAGGRSYKAITALLDLEALQASEDPEAAAQEALLSLKKESGWLFQTPVAPPYASGTGTGAFRFPDPQTLADALKEKFGN